VTSQPTRHHTWPTSTGAPFSHSRCLRTYVVLTQHNNQLAITHGRHQLGLLSLTLNTSQLTLTSPSHRSYPYKSSYLMHGLSTLLAWPVRKACTQLFGSFSSDGELFDAVVAAVSMYYNNTNDVPCYDITGQVNSSDAAVKVKRSGARRGSPALRRFFNSPVGAGARPVDTADAASCSGSWGYQVRSLASDVTCAATLSLL
jgi:hypothetical protein